jgi:tetratricopeptide (TPR) repeat protein
MQWLQRALILLSAFAVCASGFGVAPDVLPALLIVTCLGMQAWHNARQVERVEQIRAGDEALHDAWHQISVRVDDVADEMTQLGQIVHALQQKLDEQEALLPGKLLLLQQGYEEAVKLLQQTVERQPTSVEAHWLLGEALVGMKRYAEALPHLHAGLVANEAHRLALVAQCEQALGRYAEAETYLLQLIAVRGETRQEDLVALGTVQSELAPSRAVATLSQALELNPFNSAARYQLIDLMMRTGAHEQAIELATEGLARNPADISCFVSRAEAYFRRGRSEDEKALLHDLMLAQAKNRKDYNIYRLRGALYQRQANRTDNAVEKQRALHQTLETYEDGLTNVPPKFHAHLLAAKSRVLLQLQRFDEAVKVAQRAVDHHANHVSNHLALALALLAARQWQAAVQAAERGMQWAGWGGRVWLAAITLFAHACAGKEPAAVHQKCMTLADDLKVNSRRFILSESWSTVCEVLKKAVSEAPDANRALVHDTIALLEQQITPEQYQHTWGNAPAAQH